MSGQRFSGLEERPFVFNYELHTLTPRDFCFEVLGIEPRALDIIDKHFTTELHPYPGLGEFETRWTLSVSKYSIRFSEPCLKVGIASGILFY